MVSSDINEALLDLGSFGFYQFYVYIISCFPVVLAGIVMLSVVFITATPNHRCNVPNCDSNQTNSQYIEPYLNFSIPMSSKPESNSYYESCVRFSSLNSYNESYNQICDKNWFNPNVTQSCDSFVYDYSKFKSTVVTEWNIVCDESWKVPLIQSIFMAGVLLGAFCFGIISDRFGRRKIFFIAPILAILACIVQINSSNFVLFVLSGALTAGCVAGTYQTAYIIGFEFVVNPKLRVWCANIQQMLFAVGEVILCYMAFNIREWRQLQTAIALIVSLTLALPWLLPESVRWQVSHGQSKNAMKTLRRAASWNKVSISNRYSFTSNAIVSHHTPLDLLLHPIIRGWSLNLFIIWFINSLVFYGLSLQASDLGSNIYETFAWLSAVELPAIFGATVAMQIYGRKKVLTVLFIVGGVSCISPIFLPNQYHWSSTAFAVFGKSMISASYALIYIYTVEIFPTVIRSTGLGTCSMFARIGGIVAPHLIRLSAFGESVPLLFSGVISVIAGLLILNLPETLNMRLPETMDDVESLKHSQSTESYDLLVSRKRSINDDSVHVNKRERSLAQDDEEKIKLLSEA